jgi:hypothetical protein
MLHDQYFNPLTTTSQTARDAYVDGLERTLAGLEGAENKFLQATLEDPNFALAHIALARHHQTWGNPAGINTRLAAAQTARNLSAQEQAHVAAFTLLMSGKPREAYALIRAHLIDHPRDTLIAQTCCGVFSLIGFSGQPGREAEHLAFTTSLAPHYGDDWWFSAQHAFAQMEAGQTGPAAASIETSIKGNPRSAHAAHIKSHLYYENGETSAGLAYLKDWMPNYSPQGILHCHLNWHVALWSLEQGDTDHMWAIIDGDMAPENTDSPTLNVVTDTAAILYRAERRGIDISPERWQKLSQYASQCFPKPGLAFVDVHAALAHAAAGNAEALEKIIDGAKGPAGDIVKTLATAFKAIAAQNWPKAEAHLAVAMQDHARIGGSRAQRDLIDFAMTSTLMRQGRAAEAKRLLNLRRPTATHEHSVLQ